MIYRFLFLVVILFGSLASAGQYMMMSLESSPTRFKTESTRSGYTDKTEILGYQLDAKSPRDVATGQSTGKRQFQPIILWKTSGASSPQFFQALMRNEQIKKITLQYYRPDDIYKQNELVYTIELENAAISGYRQVMGTPENSEFRAKTQGLYDEISIVFEKMTVTDNKAKTSATETWRSNN
jgi:type VI secretion system secreted protein Hcp